MSIWKHKEEIKRLLDNPDGTEVWCRRILGKYWTLLSHTPTWEHNMVYIVDDKHAELRKEWIDKGKPQLQYNYKNGWQDLESNDPSWNIRIDYRIKENDKHAELRKEWIDRGKPQLQYNYKNGWRDVEGNDPSWNINISYRIKESEWRTPEGEDPIEYHANRLMGKGDNCYIAIDNGWYTVMCDEPFAPLGVVLMSEKVATKIVDALNVGDLRLSPQRRG